MRSTHPTVQWVLGLFLVVKWPGREANHSPPSVLNFRISGAIHQLPIYIFMAWTWTALSSVESEAKATVESVVLRRRQRIRNGLRKAYFVLRRDSSTSPDKCQSFRENDKIRNVN